MLNGICARFVERIAAGDVVLQLSIGIGAQPHIARREIGDGSIGACSIGRGADQGDRRVDLMHSIAQPPQHRAGVGGIDRFAQRFALERDGGVGGDDEEG